MGKTLLLKVRPCCDIEDFIFMLIQTGVNFDRIDNATDTVVVYVEDETQQQVISFFNNVCGLFEKNIHFKILMS